MASALGVDLVTSCMGDLDRLGLGFGCFFADDSIFCIGSVFVCLCHLNLEGLPDLRPSDPM